MALQFASDPNNFEQNLKTLITQIGQCSQNAVIVAPELCLTNFSFDNLEEADCFSRQALQKLLPHLKNRIVALSVIEKRNGHFYNCAKVIHHGKIIHSQDKVKLFKFGKEHHYYHAGEREKIKIVHIDDLKVAILICFEIRFIQFWQRIQGADIILIPALWGALRKSQLEQITEAMAVLQQAFVIVANSSQADMASSSGIITPFGEVYRDDQAVLIRRLVDLGEIKKMRRYMDIGLK